MEINIKRWTNPDYNLTSHTIQYQSNDITIFNTVPNQYYLNTIGIFNLIVKFDLNSMINEHNLYMYTIPNYFNPSFRFNQFKIYNLIITFDLIQILLPTNCIFTKYSINLITNQIQT